MVKSPFPKMGIMKRTTKGKEYGLNLFLLRDVRGPVTCC